MKLSTIAQSTCLFAMALGSSASAELRLHYRFDETRPLGADVRDFGSAPAADGTLVNGAEETGITPAGFSCESLGVNALAGQSHYLTTIGDVQKIDTLSDMTVTFWLNFQGNPAVEDRILSDTIEFAAPLPPVGSGGWELLVNENPQAGSFELLFAVDQVISSVNVQSGVAPSPTLNADNRWVFVALTFNASDELRWYAGTEETPVSFDNTAWLFNFGIGDNSEPLRVGSSVYDPDTDRTPPALIDDVRIYNEVLTQNQIEAIRRENVELIVPDTGPWFGPVPVGGCNSRADDVSADGSTVVGQKILVPLASGAIGFHFRANQTSFIEDFPGGARFLGAEGVSADGSVVTGFGTTADGNEAFRWSGGAAQGLGTLNIGDETFGLGISADGGIIVGINFLGSNMDLSRGFWWQTGVMQEIVPLPTGEPNIDPESSAWGVSGDGDVIVGATSTTNGYEAYRMINGQVIPIGDLPGGAVNGGAFGVSADGSTVVGVGESDNGDEAFRWRDGQMIPLGDFPGGDFESRGIDVTADGSVVVGLGEIDGGLVSLAQAFIWDEKNGLRSLKDVLEQDYGLDLTGWHLGAAEGISDDGSTIVGWGDNPLGRRSAWIARIPPLAPGADLDEDGDVDFNDMDVFDACAAGSGPATPYNPINLPAGCAVIPNPQGILPIDFDCDGDLDQDDFARMQLCHSGENVPASYACAP